MTAILFIQTTFSFLHESQRTLTQNSIQIASNKKNVHQVERLPCNQGEGGENELCPAEPLFLNRGAIATPKSRPARTWTGLSVLYLSYTKYRRRWAACTRILRTRTQYVRTGCVPGTERESAGHARPTRESRTKTNPLSSRPPLTQSSECLDRSNEFRVFERPLITDTGGRVLLLTMSNIGCDNYRKLVRKSKQKKTKEARKERKI